MIISFCHKGLEAFYNTWTVRGIQAAHAAKLRRVLALLEVASGPTDLNIPAFRLHPLKGDLEGYFWVNGNWRITLLVSMWSWLTMSITTKGGTAWWWIPPILENFKRGCDWSIRLKCERNRRTSGDLSRYVISRHQWSRGDQLGLGAAVRNGWSEYRESLASNAGQLWSGSGQIITPANRPGVAGQSRFLRRKFFNESGGILGQIR